MTSRPLVVLIGPPGSGKSTVAAALAQQLGVGCRDTDADIERVAGESIPDIFVVRGEAQFRKLEADTVATALREHTGVLALGGGAPMTPGVDTMLDGHRVVFLEVGIADAARRIGFDQSRPLLAVNPRATWVKLMNARRPTYERLAQLTVDTAGRGADEVVQDIAEWLARQ